MLGFQEPLDCRTSYSGVLDLRTVRADSSAGSWSSEGPPSPSDCRLPSPSDRMTGSPNDCHLPPVRSPNDCRLRARSPHDVCSSQGPCPVLTPPRDSSMSPPMLGVVSPTLAITQRVLAAATAPQGTRPFKAYPKDPLTLSTQSDAYLQFRQHMLNQVRSAKQPTIRKRPASPVSPASGQLSLQQPTSSGHDSSDDKDAAYWERRRKNNEAAKRSRDARRAKEDEIAIRAAFLEQENLRLKYQVAALTDETQKLRCLLYKSEGPLTGAV